MMKPSINITNDMLSLVAEIDEFKGAWKALGNLSPDRLGVLKKIATIESVGSSTRIEGAKLTDGEVEALLAGLDLRSFRSRDEEEVAGYAEAMNLIFESFEEISLTENNVKQLHGILLKHSSKDVRHRGEYRDDADGQRRGRRLRGRGCKGRRGGDGYDVDGKPRPPGEHPRTRLRPHRCRGRV